MPKSDLIKLECEFCGNYDTLDVRDSAEKVIPIIARWKGVMDGDAPPAQADSHRWYDCLECLIAGEKRQAERKSAEAIKQRELDEKLAKANEALKRSGFMDKVEA